MADRSTMATAEQTTERHAILTELLGAGAVVTRDVPPKVFAAGNPCRVVKEL